MEERMRLILEVLEDTYSVSEVCRRYGVSRKTAYKWLARYEQGGVEALGDRSRAPHRHPGETCRAVREAILAIKRRFPTWGAPKIRVRLERDYPAWGRYPAVSTIGLFLRKQHLTSPRRRRRTASPTVLPLTRGDHVNQVWCADFKGHFRTGDGRRCTPLTISDHASRYLLCCRHVSCPSSALVKRWFGRVFREYGLPEVIRTDNGTPFSSRGLGGLSQLSYWWIRLGIHPERIQPGHPEQNGRHERLHKTLKAETARPPAGSLAAQQQRFDRFRRAYNEERPHAGLQMRTPYVCYRHSARALPRRVPPVWYPGHMTVCRVQPHGDIRYLHRRLFATESLAGEDVGIEQTDEDTSLVYYCRYLLGRIDHRRWLLVPAEPTCLPARRPDS
jgi:transposase InsO family protein